MTNIDNWCILYNYYYYFGFVMVCRRMVGALYRSRSLYYGYNKLVFILWIILIIGGYSIINIIILCFCDGLPSCGWRSLSFALPCIMDIINWLNILMINNIDNWMINNIVFVMVCRRICPFGLEKFIIFHMALSTVRAPLYYG